MHFVSFCIFLAALGVSQGDRQGAADVQHSATQAKDVQKDFIGDGEAHESKAQLESTVSLSVGVNHLHKVSLHNTHDASSDQKAAVNSKQQTSVQLSNVLEMKLMKEGIVELDEEEIEEDLGDKSGLQKSSMLQNTLNRKGAANEQQRPRTIPDVAGTFVIAAQAIKLPQGGLIPVGSVGELQHGSGGFKVHWRMPVNVGSKQYYAHQNTDIVPEGRLPSIGQVGKNQLILRVNAQKPIEWEDSGDENSKDGPLSRRIPPQKAAKPKCKDWMVQCSQRQFGNESARDERSLYQHRVHIVREKAQDDMGGCDFHFECVNAIPFKVDWDASEFIRSGPECKGHWIGTNFAECFVGKKDPRYGENGHVRDDMWNKMCGVCGYDACIPGTEGCKFRGGHENSNPKNNIYQDWDRKKVFDQDTR